MPGLLITGTDTEIGKTYASCLIVKELIDAGLKVAVMKPIASGASLVDGELKNDDALSLMSISNVDAEYKQVNPYVFEPAISPHIAAEQAGVEINLQNIKQAYLELEKHSDIVVVEGVGGWFAPLSRQCTLADLADVLAIPVVLVIGMRLGCLNHALLTFQAIRQSNCVLAGWISNHLKDGLMAEEENIDTLKHFLYDIPYLANIPFSSEKLKHKQNSQTFFFDKQQLIDTLFSKK